MRTRIRLGAVTWHWATNVVCAGPDERLIVTRGLGATAADAEAALMKADRMEWRDAGFRRWRIRRCPEGLTFASHYETLGPVASDPSVPLASLANEELEELLHVARREGGGTSRRPGSGRT